MMTYIPSLDGYFTHRLDVFKLSLESLIHTVKPQCDIMILNNGSCGEVQSYLEELLRAGRIDYVIHSQRNLGVIGGFKVLFNAIPGEIVAYSDDDVLYYPGWLDAHIEIFDTFPNVGLVSGAPVGYSSEGAFTSVDQFISKAHRDIEVSEKPRNHSWEADWAESTGRSVNDHLAKIKSTPNIHITIRGVEAVKSSKHFQFLAPKNVICQALTTDWSGSMMDELVSMDETVDRLGYLRLCTPTRFSRHIGNALTEEIAEEARRLEIPFETKIQEIQYADHWLLKIPGSGRILWPLYRWLFKVLHRVK
jgi:hypothetical protein